MKKIPVSLGNKQLGTKEALVDDEDYERLSKHNWFFDQTQIYAKMTFETGRASPKTFSLKVRMDHFVFNFTPYINGRIKHLNGDPYDCRRKNLGVYIKDRGTTHYPKTIFLGVIRTAGRLKKQNPNDEYLYFWGPNAGKNGLNIVGGGDDITHYAEQYDLWVRDEFGAETRANFLLKPLVRQDTSDGDGA